MSNIKSCNDENFFKGNENAYPVIIKGFMGEPVLMDKKYIQNNIITVSKIGRKTQISLDVKYAYCYDDKVLEGIKEKYKCKNKIGLEKEWQKAKPIMST